MKNLFLVSVGRKVITELLNNPYAVAAFPKEVFFKEGDLVEPN